MTDWRDSAACEGMDREMFFPKDRKGGARQALNVCVRCPVRWECLEWAMEVESSTNATYHRYGIYGGTVPRTRTLLSRGEWVVLDTPCDECGQPFVPVQKNRARFCSLGCQAKHNYSHVSEQAAEAGVTIREWGQANGWTSTRS